MRTPPFRRRPSLSYLEAALAAFALAVPLAAGAEEATPQITVKVGDGQPTIYNGTSDPTLTKYLEDNRVGPGDPLISGDQAGYVFVPLVTPFSPEQEKPASYIPNSRPSNVITTIENWTGTGYSVAGGGLMSGEGDVFGNEVTITGTTTIAGKLIGGVNAGTGKVGGGEGKGNKVSLESGTVGNDVIGGLGVGEHIDEISWNSVNISGGEVTGSVTGG
jgi:hypothetical protein